MKWKAAGKNETRMVSSDWRYSIERNSRGQWVAWCRNPIKNIGGPFDQKIDAMSCCESHATQGAPSCAMT